MLSKTWQSAALRHCQSSILPQPAADEMSCSGGGVKENEPSTALLNLGNVELKKAVQPLNKLLPANRARQSVDLPRWRTRRRRPIWASIGGGTNRDSPILCFGVWWYREQEENKMRSSRVGGIADERREEFVRQREPQDGAMYAGQKSGLKAPG